MAVIKTIDLVGASEDSWDDAARQALQEARKTIRQLESMEILEQSARLSAGGDITEFLTHVRIHFRLER